MNPIHRQEREETYLKIINNYEKQEQYLLSEAFAILVNDMETYFQSGELVDVLGELYNELELYNKWAGQYFTSQHIAELMTKVSFNDSIILQKQHMTLLEPACGSGVMILSFANAMKEKGHDFRTKLVITAVDIDLKCVYMTYIQLSLYGIPAVVIHGDSLRLQEWSRWYTPTYIMENWVWKQPCRLTTKTNTYDDEILKTLSQPMYGAYRKIFGYGNNNELNEDIITDKQVIDGQEDKKEEIKKTEFNYTIKKNGQMSLF